MSSVQAGKLETTASRLSSIEHPLYSVLLLAGLAVLLLLALRHGQEWDGDFELYLLNARNIALGLPYAQTGYIYNPANAIHPAAYPPGLPLLLAPFCAWFGAVTAVMKLVCLAMFVLFLGVFLRIARTFLPTSFALTITAAIGLQPFVIDFENMADSEFPFMFFCYVALYLLYRIQSDELRLTRSTIPWIAAAAVAVAFAYLTRSIGMVLFPAAVVLPLMNRRSPAAPTIAALASAAIIICLVQLALPADVGTYISYFRGYSLHGLIVRAERYALVNGSLLGHATVIEQVASTALDVLGAVGLFARLRRFTIFETFFALYAAFIVVFPVNDEVSRYSLPIWPLLFLYAAIGLKAFGGLIGTRVRLALSCIVGVGILGVCAAEDIHKDFGPIPYSTDAAQSRQLFATIQDKLPKDARILARKPTIIALYTGRQAAVWPDPVTDAQLWAFMRRLNIDYIVQNVSNLGERVPSDDPLNTFVARNRSRLEVVFENEWFDLYRAK